MAGRRTDYHRMRRQRRRGWLILSHTQVENLLRRLEDLRHEINVEEEESGNSRSKTPFHPSLTK